MCRINIKIKNCGKFNEYLNETIYVDSPNKRKSRPRICDIERATVMSINRKLVCRRKRELSWPPIKNHANKLQGKIKFSEQLYSKHNIKDVCRIFDESDPNINMQSSRIALVRDNNSNANTLTTTALAQATILITNLLKVSMKTPPTIHTTAIHPTINYIPSAISIRLKQ